MRFLFILIAAFIGCICAVSLPLENVKAESANVKEFRPMLLNREKRQFGGGFRGGNRFGGFGGRLAY